jgi:hypothetical protein
MFEKLPNILVGVLGLCLFALFATQLKSGRALKLGRGLGPQRFLEKASEPGGYWFNQIAVLVGALAFVALALFKDMPLQ